MFDFLTPYTIYITLHIFGAILGAGSAYFSDSMFFLSVKDSRFMPTELKFLKHGSRMVWAGLGLLVLSGLGLFSLTPDFYLGSSKFLAKMSIILIIIVNGLIFHFVHMPLMEKHKSEDLAKSKEFRRGSAAIIASGAVSVISWTATVILGVAPELPFDYWTIMALYLVAIAGGVTVGLLLKDRILFGGKR